MSAGTAGSVGGVSVKEAAKRRIIEDMIEIVKVKMNLSGDDIEKGPASGDEATNSSGSSKAYIALIVDVHTLRIVSGACRQYDILERGVTVVEQIEKSRQPLSDLDAVYFLSPEDHSVDLLLKDHKASSALYRYSHVFFSGPLNEKLFDQLAKEEAFVNRCYSLYELNVDYVSFEPRVFYCDKPLTIRYLRGSSDVNMITSLIRRHVDCLTSVCAALREKPAVRYMAKSGVSNLSEKIALGFRREIDSLAAAMDRLKKPFRNKGTTFLIIDRSIDSAGLLLHEFSYQALALDVLDGVQGAGGVKWVLGLDHNQVGDDAGMTVVPSFTFQSVTGKGDEELKHSVLADHDDLWVKFRHMHVKDVSEITTAEVRDFSRSHNLAKLQKGDGRRNSDADPMDLLRGLPEYQDILSKYSLHIELSKQCFDAIEKLKLMEIGKIEQELATGVDDEGKDVSCIKVFQSLTTLVQSGRIGPEEKLRLVALYLSQVNDVNESSAQTLVRTAASLSMEYESIVKQFLTLGIHGTKAASGVQSASEKGAGASSRHSHKLANDKNQLKRNKARAKASSYVNCRFIPKLKDLVESVLTNVVDNTEYPLIGSSSASAPSYSAIGGDTSPTSIRSTASMWGQTKAAADGQLAEENEGRTGDEGKRRQKIIVFVIGGITLAETRAMAELEQQYNCDVLIGGSCLLTPKRLFEILLAPTPIL